MQLNVETLAGVKVVVVPTDALEAARAPAFKPLLMTAIADADKVVLDLVDVKFIDSMGCSVILSCLRDLTTRKGELKLCNLSKPVRAVVELIRMQKIVDILNDRDEALRAFAV